MNTTSLYELVQHILTTGYITLDAEDQLRRHLRSHYGRKDLKAFLRLQKAFVDGLVRQQSRELWYAQTP